MPNWYFAHWAFAIGVGIPCCILLWSIAIGVLNMIVREIVRSWWS